MIKKHKNFKKLTTTIAILFLMVFVAFWVWRPSPAEAAWFDDNFAYRQTVAVTNSGSAQTDYQIPISLDTATLITAGKMRSDCGDIRVTDYSGKQLPIFIETGTNACNTATTQIWTKVPTVPTPNNALLLYYGNPSANSVSNGNQVFEFFDTFDTLDNSKWTLTGSPTVSGGVTALTNGQTLVSNSTVTSSSGLARIIARVKQAATNQTAGKIGLYNSNDAASIGFGNLEEKLSQIVPSNIISHHKLEETTSTDANQFKASGYLDTGKLNQAVSMYGNAAGTTGSTLTFNRGAQISGNNYEHFNGNQGTISFWFKPNWSGNPSINKYLFAQSNGSPTIVIDTSGNLATNYWDGSANRTASKSVSWSSSSWYYITAKWDTDNAVSGSQYITISSNTSESTNGYTSSFTANTPNAVSYIGRFHNTNTNQADGLIDDFAIFDRVLTTTEISNIYNSGTGREAGYVADPSLKFYAKMDGSGTLSPVTYNGGATVDQTAYNSSTNTNGNMVTDGNMETAGVANWTAQNSATVAKDTTAANLLYDTQVLKVTIGASQTWGQGRQDVAISANTNYFISGWVKSSGSNSSFFQIGDNGTGGYIYLGGRQSHASWTYVEGSYKTTATANSFYVLCTTESGVAGDYVLCDNFSITPNLVDNGGMEGTYATCNTDQNCAPGWSSGRWGTTTGVSATEDGVTLHSGAKSQSFGASTTAASSGVSLYSSTAFSATSGQSYLYSVWLKGSGTLQTNVRRSGDTSVRIIANSAVSLTSSWTKYSWIGKASETNTDYQVFLYYADTNAGTVNVDDVSVIPLDNTALSFQAWAPAVDTATANQLSIHGDSDGVSSNTSGKLNNGYTFDGSTGYLRQKTYLTNIGTLTYGTNALTDTGQTFTSYKASPATYMIVVTNSDNTTSWGYIGTTSGATIVDVFTTKALSVAGWNGTSPSGKTPVGYEVRKTDYQITTDFTVGAWINSTNLTGNNRGIIVKGDVGISGGWIFQTNTSKKLLLTLPGGGTTTSTNAIDVNSWYHIAAVYHSSARTVDFYINGVASDTGAAGFALSDNYIPLSIGSLPTNGVYGNFFPGSIDSPFVLNTALTADQVAALYQYHSLATTNNGSINVVNGSATPTNDTNYHTYLITAGSSSLTASSDNTVFATSSTNLPNEAVNLRLMNSDSTNALTVDWVAVAKQASTAPTVAAPASEEKGGAPVAYWKFDDGTGTNAQDSSPNNNDGTITGATWQTENMCVSGKCLKFDGTTSYVDTGTSAGNYTDNFTVSTWVRSATKNKRILARRISSGATQYDLYLDSTGGQASLYDGTTEFISTTDLTDNKWHFVSWSINGASSKIYIDGKLEKTFSPTIISQSTKTLIGAFQGAGGVGVTAVFNGFLDDVKIYNYARTAAQVKSDYAAGKARSSSTKGTSGNLGSNPKNSDALSNGLVGYWKMDEASWTNNCSTASVLDASGNGNNGKSCPNSTGPTGGTAGKFGNGGSFDGSDDYVQTTNTFNFNSYSQQSFSLWFKVNTLPTGSNKATLYVHSDSNLSTGFDQILYITNASKVGLIAYNAAIQATSLVTTNSIVSGAWNNVTFTSNGNTLQMYLNGNLETTGSLVGFYSIARPIAFGRYDTGYVPFTGLLDEARLYNRALSPREVRDLYNWAPGPRVYLKMEEGSGTSANDDSGNARTGTLNGNPVWAPGKYGKGVKLDGTGDYTQVSDF